MGLIAIGEKMSLARCPECGHNRVLIRVSNGVKSGKGAGRHLEFRTHPAAAPNRQGTPLTEPRCAGSRTRPPLRA